MTVGESLTEARHRAGLSVDELSERTRIRVTVIASIERDDYEACGGDLYVRGYLRAIAGAIGIDAEPLIHSYDQGRATARIATTATRFDLPPIPRDPATRFDLPPIPTDPAMTRFDLPPLTEDLMAAGYELPPGGTSALAGPAAQDRRADAGAVTGARPRTRVSGRGLLIGTAVVVVLAVAGAVGVRLASSSPATSRNTAATSAPRTATSAKTAAAPKSARTAKPARSTGARRTADRLPVTALPIAAAEAFGPGGLANGDNPENAHYAIAGDASRPWSTQWYATPRFGMLKHGTGLLLDLGRRVTITSVRLDLADYQGANLQLRIGDTADPGGFTVAATATGTGGVVRLTLPSQASARYLLIWFTLLPPDGSGHYMESVSRVVVNGRS